MERMSERDADERGADGDGADEYVCDVCDERFGSSEALKTHVHEVGLVE